MAREINTIVIHCSATEFGNKSLFKRWHKKRGWEDVGYHFIITNAYPLKKYWDKKTPDFKADGHIENGRHVEVAGAHVRLHNDNSIGICLVGDRTFTSKQFESLKKLIKKITSEYKIKSIRGHYEFDTAKEQGKTCPNIDMDWLRKLLA
ncbi:MAG: N-acetylmuramoyl-L-alanine amidase [Candidatus Delongbacteria bacterium]|nr:N-acetylmuramoyl-L-alanine amidase [Candidatus Delongbacteria bacterium]MCG2760025.1 N-acetylmuramoyl-L-alanine amidase [Candidatus Delongbacteria bacterium]